MKNSIIIAIVLIGVSCNSGAHKNAQSDNNKQLTNSSDSNLNNSQTIKNNIPDIPKTTLKTDTIFYSNKYDFDNNGNNDDLVVYKKGDSIYLKIAKSSAINLYTNALNGLYNETGKILPVVVFDFNNDKKMDIGLLAADSIVEDESFFHIYSLVDNVVKDNPFYYSDSKSYNALIAKNNFALINTKSGAIYCCTNTVAVETGNGIAYKIDKYSWDTNKSKLFFQGSKQVNETALQKPLKIPF